MCVFETLALCIHETKAVCVAMTACICILQSMTDYGWMCVRMSTLAVD